MTGQFRESLMCLLRPVAQETSRRVIAILSCLSTSAEGHQPRCLWYKWCRRTTATCWQNLTASTRFCLLSDWTLADLRYAPPSHVYPSIMSVIGQSQSDSSIGYRSSISQKKQATLPEISYGNSPFCSQ